MAEVNEQELPGIGRLYELTGLEGGTVTVIIHHSGRRDLYVFVDGAEEPSGTVGLSDDQARRLGAVLGGAYFKPAVVEEVEAVIGALLIDWVTLGEESPAARRTIAELEVRQRTGMTIAAILRDGSALIAPGPDERLYPGDRLVVVGRREDLPQLRSYVVG